jgi:hypothetical protein
MQPRFVESSQRILSKMMQLSVLSENREQHKEQSLGTYLDL